MTIGEKKLWKLYNYIKSPFRIEIAILLIVIGFMLLYQMNVVSAKKLYTIANDVGVDTSRYDLLTRKGYMVDEIINCIDTHGITSSTYAGDISIFDSEDVYIQAIKTLSFDIGYDNLLTTGEKILLNYRTDSSTSSEIVLNVSDMEECVYNIIMLGISNTTIYEIASEKLLTLQKCEFILEILYIISILTGVCMIISYGFHYIKYLFLKKIFRNCL